MWGSDAFCGGNGGVLGVDGRGRSQDTPFFQHMMPKNQLDETHSARRSLLPSSVAKGASAGKTEPGRAQNFKKKDNVGLVLI